MENYLKLYKNREEYEQNSGTSIFSHIVESIELINDTPDPCATPNVEVSVTMPSEADEMGYAALSLFRYDFFNSWDDKPFDVYVDGKKAVLETREMTREEMLELANEGRLVVINRITVGSEQMDIYQLISIANKQHKIKFVFDSSMANQEYCFTSFSINDRYYSSRYNIVRDNPNTFTCIEDGGCVE